MPKLVLYIATSLDGYIARPEGEIDWLTRYENRSTDFGYHEFYAMIDALLIGRKTYEAVASFGPWPHADRPCYVMSRSARIFPHASSRRGSLREVVEELKGRHGAIWLVGGADLVQQALSEQLLDEMIVTIAPVILGSGIPLFEGPMGEVRLDHLETRSYTGGLVQVKYCVRRGA